MEQKSPEKMSIQELKAHMFDVNNEIVMRQNYQNQCGQILQNKVAEENKPIIGEVKEPEKVKK